MEYRDSDGSGGVLRSERWGLTGKPDYLIRRGKHLIPVEVKPGRQGTRPYRSDLLQLAAYCVLVGETYGVEPPYGILRYQRTSLKVPFGADLRADLAATLAEMRGAAAAGDVAADRPSAAQCRACGCQRVCSDRTE